MRNYKISRRKCKGKIYDIDLGDTFYFIMAPKAHTIEVEIDKQNHIKLHNFYTVKKTIK